MPATWGGKRWPRSGRAPLGPASGIGAGAGPQTLAGPASAVEALHGWQAPQSLTSEQAPAVHSPLVHVSPGRHERPPASAGAQKRVACCVTLSLAPVRL